MTNELEEKFACFATVIGQEMGDIIRCMVEAEIVAQTEKIRNLQLLLSGTVCEPTLPDNTSV
jgi:hypothetical protein